MPAEFNLGTLNSNGTPVSANHSVGNSDRSDTFSFRLGDRGNINLSLTGMSNDADVRLYRDNNNNGRIDDGTDTFLGSSTYGSNNDDAINVADQSAGAYVAEVYQYSGDTRYDLRLSTTPPPLTTNPSNLLPVETRVGNSLGYLTEDRTLYGSINSNNTADVYAFQLTHGTGGSFQESVDITLSGLSNDADIRLIRDFNGNRIVDAGDEIIRSGDLGSANEHLSVNDNNPYFLQVYQYSGNTDYTLTFDHNFAIV